MTHAPIFAGQRSDAGHLNTLIDFNVYTPEFVGSTSDPNVGSTGTLFGVWWRSGHKINAWVLIQFNGTGIAAGSGSYAFGLPFPIDDNFNHRNALLDSTTYGRGNISDISAPDVQGVTPVAGVSAFFTASRVGLRRPGTSSLVAGNTYVWAAGDYISFHVEYIADAASMPVTGATQDVYADALPFPAKATRYIDDYRPYPAVLVDANGDPMSIGDEGVTVGWWRRSGRLVTGAVRTWFEAAAAPSGTFHHTLPVGADSDLMVPSTATGTARVAIGTGHARDNSTGANTAGLVGHVQDLSGLWVMRYYPVTGTGSVSATSPFTWATDDRLSSDFVYIADASALDQ